MTALPTATADPNSRSPRAILAVSTILLSWLLMQVIHESGHVVGAMLTGGTVRRVVLVPWELSRTDLHENPNPLVVCWAGPIVGAIFPVLVWLVARRLKWKIGFWLRFLAGFCLIANGAYIGVGALTHDGDSGDLLRAGSPLWTLWVFGVVTVPLGFMAWHRLGRDFGIGSNAVVVRWKAATRCLLLLITVIMIELIFACG